MFNFGMVRIWDDIISSKLHLQFQDGSIYVYHPLPENKSYWEGKTKIPTNYIYFVESRDREPLDLTSLLWFNQYAKALQKPELKGRQYAS